MCKPLLILDADGVFLDESIYWETALRVALTVNAIAVPDDPDWADLTRHAFGKVGLQRVAKSRGCNSNWDLCAVLAQALSSQNVRRASGAALSERDWAGAAAVLNRAAGKLWHERVPCGTGRSSSFGDPLAGFGLDRTGEYYRRLQVEFQRTLCTDSGHDTVGTNWRLLRSKESIREALTSFRNAGFELAICTGRNRTELVEPLSGFGLEEFFDSDRLITAEHVTAAERALDMGHLGKPHWFPVACAFLGESEARRAVRSGRAAAISIASGVYVGDALADFRSVSGARDIGLPLNYVHIRSTSTDAAQEDEIAGAPFTLGVAEDLAGAASLLSSTHGKDRS